MKKLGWFSGAVLLLYSLVALTIAASSDEIDFSESLPSGQVADTTMSNQNQAAPTDDSAIRTLWFGHSLMEYRAAPDENIPAINIPKTVDAIHALARQAGRSTRAPGETVSHYAGPRDLVYWLEGDGNAPAKLKNTERPWDYVIGIGFMHLVHHRGGRRKFRSQEFAVPTWKDNLKGALRDLVDLSTFGKFYRRKVEAITLNNYRFIQAANSLSPKTTWLNYIGPVLSDRPENQASVDARFSCMAQTAQSTGARVGNVPVGAALRRAEKALKSERLSASLQRADRLHYTAAGAFLAANVFYSYLYDVNPIGLSVPDGLAEYFQGASGENTKRLLQTVAWATVQEAKRSPLSPCGSARLAVDDLGQLILENKK